MSDWMSVEEMGDWLGIGRSTSYDLVKQPGFPAVKIGRLIRVSRTGLEAWLESQRVNKDTESIK